MFWVNNAGNAHGLESISEGNIADWDAMMDGNVKGLLYVSQPIIKIMKAREIQVISSIFLRLLRDKRMQMVWCIVHQNVL